MQKTFLVAFLLGIMGCGHPVARIRNESSTKLQNVHVSGRGFEVIISEVQRSESRVVTIKPQGESGVAVQFEANGRKVSTPKQGYFEDDPEYVIDIVVKPNLSVAVRSDLVAR